jgi:hypothetical protein
MDPRKVVVEHAPGLVDHFLPIRALGVIATVTGYSVVAREHLTAAP